jgi:TrmH family RNA methyltransferase
VVRRQDLTAGELEHAVDEATLIVLLEGIQDPGNLGSILRSADGAGANLCFVCGSSVDPYHPRAVRSTMGSLFRVPVVEKSLDSVLDRLRRSAVKLVGADARDGAEYDLADLAGPLALVFGSEGAGLAPEVRARLDLVLRIPLREGVESLSVGAAAAVMLFEVARQRRS